MFYFMNESHSFPSLFHFLRTVGFSCVWPPCNSMTFPPRQKEVRNSHKTLRSTVSLILLIPAATLHLFNLIDLLWACLFFLFRGWEFFTECAMIFDTHFLFRRCMFSLMCRLFFWVGGICIRCYGRLWKGLALNWSGRLRRAQGQRGRVAGSSICRQNSPPSGAGCLTNLRHTCKRTYTHTHRRRCSSHPQINSCTVHKYICRHTHAQT